MKWDQTLEGPRIHDLRHTAACLWLAHEAIATTNRYLHFLGTSADRAGLDRLNDPDGGTHRGPERAAARTGVRRG